MKKIPATDLKVGMVLVSEGLLDEERRDRITSVTIGNGIVRFEGDGLKGWVDETSTVEVEG